MSQYLSGSLHRAAAAGCPVLLLGLLSLTAHAQGTLTIANGYGNSVSIYLSGHTPTNPFGVFAGDFAASLPGAPAGFPSNFEAFCVDLNKAANLGSPYAVTETSANTLSRGGQVSWLAENALYIYANHPGYTANQQRASLQLAIWNTLYDTDNSVSGGTFHVDTEPGGEETLANLYLSDSIGKSASGTQVVDASSHNYQPLIKSNTNTPEPGVIAYAVLLGGGSLSLLGRRRTPRVKR